ENLMQRKQAVLNQLQSLSALASQSAADVPEMRPLADLSDDLEAFTEEATAEQSAADETAIRPAVQIGDGPGAPDDADDADGSDGSDEVEDNEDTANLGDPTAADATPPMKKPGPATAQSEDDQA